MSVGSLYFHNPVIFVLIFRFLSIFFSLLSFITLEEVDQALHMLRNLVRTSKSAEPSN